MATVTIRDMNTVKILERRLGRQLDEVEMSGESFVVELEDGTFDYLSVPILVFPDELLPAHALVDGVMDNGESDERLDEAI